jgi:hypothetical protein
MLAPWTPARRSTRQPTSRARSARRGTSPTRPWPPSPGWRCASAGRCSWRASPAPARPRSPKPSPRLGPAAHPPAVLRGHRRDPGPLRLGLPPPDPPRARARGRRRRAPRCRRGRGRPLRRALPARPPGAARPARVALRAAHRRDRPGRRRVRGLPARGALDVAGDHPRARHGRRDAPSAGRASSPPIAPASCTTPSSAAVSITGSSTLGSQRELAIVRSRAPEVPRPSPTRSSGSSTASAPIASCSSPPASPRPSTGPGPCNELGTRELDTATAAAPSASP